MEKISPRAPFNNNIFHNYESCTKGGTMGNFFI